MATRFDLTSSAPPYTPATRRGSWTTASGEDVQLLGRKPAGSAGTSSISLAAGSGTRKVLLHRSISAGAIKAGTISGTVTWTIGAKESNALLDAVWHMHIYVTSGDSDTPRGTLLSNFTGATEFGTTAAGASEGAQTVSPVTVSVGDRLVVEIGYETSTTTASSYSATINYGSTGTTDLAAAATTVTTDPGWVEFSGTDGLFTPAIGTLVDQFPSSIDAKWVTTGSVTATSGRARIPCGTTLANLYTASLYEIQGSTLAFQVPTLPAAGGGSGVTFSAYLSAGPTVSTTNLEISYSPNTGNLMFRNNIGGSDASPTTITYSATSHAWWRFRESSGQILMETAPDGATWTTQRTIATPSQWMRLGNLISYFEAVRSSGTADFAEIDNINSSGGTTLALGTAGAIETAQALTRAKQRTVGPAGSVDTAQPATRTKHLQLGIAIDTSTAMPITRAKARPLSPAGDVDTAQGSTRSKSRSLAPAQAADSAQAAARTKQSTLASAVEISAAQAAARAKRTTLNPAHEIDTGVTLIEVGPELGDIQAGPARAHWTAGPTRHRWTS